MSYWACHIEQRRMRQEIDWDDVSIGLTLTSGPEIWILRMFSLKAGPVTLGEAFLQIPIASLACWKTSASFSSVSSVNSELKRCNFSFSSELASALAMMETVVILRVSRLHVICVAYLVHSSAALGKAKPVIPSRTELFPEL